MAGDSSAEAVSRRWRRLVEACSVEPALEHFLHSILVIEPLVRSEEGVNGLRPAATENLLDAGVIDPALGEPGRERGCDFIPPDSSASGALRPPPYHPLRPTKT